MNRKIYYQALYALLVLTGFGLLFSACQNEELAIVTYPEPALTSFSPNSGRPGELVTITGTDFGDYAPAVSVFFNGVPAEMVSVADTKIEVRVPNDGVTGPIEVKVWTHRKVTEDDFTVIPGAKILSLSPAAGEAGDQVSILGESFGTELSEVSVFFTGPEEPVAANIVSLTDEEIVVTVPAGGVTGPVRLVVGPQELLGPIFEYPVSSLEFQFDADGETEGWTTSHNSTNQVGFGVMKVSFDMNATQRRADFAHTGGMTVHAGVYPIIAIRMIDKPASGNLIFDTNLGKYKNGNNNWEGIIDDNVYYYDLRNPFGSGNSLSLTEETEFSTFQWKVADINTDETGYFVDWVKTFSSVAELEAYVTEQNPGQNHYGFSGPEREVTPASLDDWIGRLNQPGTTTFIEDGYAKVTFGTPSDGSSAARADFNYSQGGNWGDPGSGISTEPWHFHPDFPIYAIKLHFVQSDGTLGGARPTTGTVRYDRLGQFNNDYIDQNVLWVDGRTWSEAEKFEGSWWAVIIADILSDELGYWVDWHRTYRSIEEMEFYLTP